MLPKIWYDEVLRAKAPGIPAALPAPDCGILHITIVAPVTTGRLRVPDIEPRRAAMVMYTGVPNRPRIVPAEQEIRYWMRAPAITVNLAAPVSEALALMREHDVRRLPVVVDTGEIRGIITQGDIRGADVLRTGGIDPLEIADILRRIKVYEVMSEAPITVEPGTGLREAAMLMIENKIGGLPVVDEHSYVVGIITESDLFESLVQVLDRINTNS